MDDGRVKELTNPSDIVGNISSAFAKLLNNNKKPIKKINNPKGS